jgi:hypothetical protein
MNNNYTIILNTHHVIENYNRKGTISGKKEFNEILAVLKAKKISHTGFCSIADGYVLIIQEPKLMKEFMNSWEDMVHKLLNITERHKYKFPTTKENADFVSWFTIEECTIMIEYCGQISRDDLLLVHNMNLSSFKDIQKSIYNIINEHDSNANVHDRDGLRLYCILKKVYSITFCPHCKRKN